MCMVRYITVPIDFKLRSPKHFGETVGDILLAFSNVKSYRIYKTIIWLYIYQGLRSVIHNTRQYCSILVPVSSR